MDKKMRRRMVFKGMFAALGVCGCSAVSNTTARQEQYVYRFVGMNETETFELGVLPLQNHLYLLDRDEFVVVPFFAVPVLTCPLEWKPRSRIASVAGHVLAATRVDVGD